MVVFATGNKEWVAGMPEVMGAADEAKRLLVDYGEHATTEDPTADGRRQLAEAALDGFARGYAKWLDLPHPPGTQPKGFRWSAVARNLNLQLESLRHAHLMLAALASSQDPTVHGLAWSQIRDGLDGFETAASELARLRGVLPSSVEGSMAQTAATRARAFQEDLAKWRAILDKEGIPH